jgi:hypothetical protein
MRCGSNSRGAHPPHYACSQLQATLHIATSRLFKILLTLDAYLIQMEHLEAKCSDAAKSRDAHKLANEERKQKREEERILQV